MTSAPDTQDTQDPVTAMPTKQPLPTLFVDGVTRLGFGPAVCRIEFHVEQLDGPPQPTLSLVIPTPSIVTFAKQLLSQMTSDESVARISAEFDRILKDMKS
ncbi:hypothetical protein [Burkholderia diffusa]|uniref:hypothetical protein n=1 Tax=Burkholderia diffusa TaxID=488732 RepID=UPI000A65930E|nr:hypothetical protein [Burkholderia diffusa]